MTLDVVRGWYEALEADDVPSAIALCSPEVEVRYPAAGRLPYGGAWKGLQGVKRWAEAHDSVEEIIEFRTDNPIADGDRAAVPAFFVADRGRLAASGKPGSCTSSGCARGAWSGSRRTSTQRRPSKPTTPDRQAAGRRETARGSSHPAPPVASTRLHTAESLDFLPLDRCSGRRCAPPGECPARQSAYHDQEDARPGNRAGRSQPEPQESGGRSRE